MQYSIVKKESFKVTGMKKELSLEDGKNLIDIPKMWDEVNNDGTADKLLELNDGDIKGVLGICVDKRDTKPGSMDYWIAVSSEGRTPDNLLSMEIPSAKWAVFEVHGPMPHSMQNAWKQIFSEWFPSSGYEHAGAPELEVYSLGNPTSPDYYSEIWIAVK